MELTILSLLLILLLPLSTLLINTLTRKKSLDTLVFVELKSKLKNKKLCSLISSLKSSLATLYNKYSNTNRQRKQLYSLLAVVYTTEVGCVALSEFNLTRPILLLPIHLANRFIAIISTSSRIVSTYYVTVFAVYCTKKRSLFLSDFYYIKIFRKNTLQQFILGKNVLYSV